MPLILSILASPRLHGTTASLLDAAENAARSQGCTIERINISSLRFAPCMACMSCRTSGQCPLPADDAHRFAQLLTQADAILIATPTYWGGMPGTLKALLDRTVYAFIDTSSPTRSIPIPLHRHKPAAAIITSTAPWPVNIMRIFTDVSGDIQRILRPSGFRIMSFLNIGGTRRLHPHPEKQLNKATALGARLARNAFKFAMSRNK